MSSTTRLTKQACKALGGQLQDLGYGQAEAETPELFARRLYPVPEHLRALDPGVVLVVGPRGAGKSELFNTFFSDDRDLAGAIFRRAPRPAGQGFRPDSAIWKAAYPAGTQFPDSRALAEQINSDEQAKKLWYAMLVRCLADEFGDRDKTRLDSMLQPMAADLGKVLGAVDDLAAAPTAALDALEAKLAREDRWIFVGYDELDTLGGYDWALMARLVRGLVAFWSDYSRRWQRIRAKIFLRSDLFRRHAGMGSADFAKLAANRAELSWSDAALLGMLVKRIANTSDELADYCRGARIAFEQDEKLGLVPKLEKLDDAYLLVERLAGVHMGSGKKKGYVRNWVLSHLRDGNSQIAPRTLVRLIEQAASKGGVNQALRPPRVIHPTALRQALADVSTDHVRQGISSEWPWLAGVRNRLGHLRLVPWRREEVVGTLGHEWEGTWGEAVGNSIRPPVDRPVDLVDYLVELGIFRQRPDGRIDVPDLYLFGLELRRKGGVKAGGRTGRRKRR